MTGPGMSWAAARSAAEGGARIARPFWHWCWLEASGGGLVLRSKGQPIENATPWGDAAQAADAEAADWIGVSADYPEAG